MKQVLLNGRGQVQVIEVPAPPLEPGYILVRTAYSLISSGTELASIEHQSSGVVGRALSRPGLVANLARQTLKDGPISVKDRIEDSLSRWNPIGYSLSGTVLEVAPEVQEILAGDRVACSGAEHAHHAEVVAVPMRLTVRVPEAVDLKSAAFAPVGAIALQGVRRSGAALGETVVVVGLGLVGLLACQLLKATGCRVLGTDPDSARCRLAKETGCEETSTDMASLAVHCSTLTGGLGADAVIVCASSSSDSPVNDAFSIARERGRVVIVGDVSMNLSRDEFYRKELDLVMSRSLGPGRYDPRYEIEGQDYPPAFVRWTESRNVEAVLGLMAGGRMDPTPLTSGSFAIDEAAAAYSHLSQGGESVAAVLCYDGAEGSDVLAAPVSRRVAIRPASPPSGRIEVGLVGAGNFARAVHLPLIRRSPQLSLRAIVGRRGPDAHHAASRFGASYVTTDVAELLDDNDIGAVWVATPHDSHADISVRALDAGKHVFVEKPLALGLEDCRRVMDAVDRSGKLLSVGFNRRFAPASTIVRAHFEGVSGPKEIVYRVRAEAVSRDHWVRDPARGGGRVLGECVHFFDWMAWLLDEEPAQVWAVRQPGADEDVTIVLRFSGGSTGTLVYTTLGAASTAKERIEVLGGGRTASIDNFEAVELVRDGSRPRRRKTKGKGHAEQLASFAETLGGGAPLAVTVRDGVRATACAVAVEASIREGVPQPVERLWADT